MRLYAVKTRLVREGDDLAEIVLESLRNQNLRLENNDIVALTSKIISYSRNHLAKLSDVRPTWKAKRLAKKYSLQPEFAEMVLRKADRICGGVEKAVLTLKNGILTANAGIDSKNAAEDKVVLWPENPKEWAEQFRRQIKRVTGKQVAVLIVDSGLIPLRVGTIGFALAVAGFNPIREYRGKKDLFGKVITITRQAVGDGLASAAHLLMGEAAERIPIVLIRDAPVDFDQSSYGAADMMMPTRECIFMNALVEH